jgi:hypothetical protein
VTDRIGALLHELKSLQEPARLQRVETFLKDASPEERTAFATVFVSDWQPSFGQSPALVVLRQEWETGQARSLARELLTVAFDPARKDEHMALLARSCETPARAELVLIEMLTLAATAVKLGADAQKVTPEQALARLLGHA